MSDVTKRVARRLRGWQELVTVGFGRRWRLVTARAEAGMATAEYAIVTLAAVAFAGLLLAIFRGGEVRDLLLGIIRDALSV
ncbi:MAG TPA: DUF4244 domain-containing protein [Micrococcales bacterium]|uniref:DUF4244 domain-containing protein n=1 Tax=Miniimonas arenae TaxID=676201 RepID=A0A5C5BDX5_9MICO|nr:DUF4244 domain-containing protein [Miniimonas arenae]TNU74911.1 DUF4244 domain-containing protein [Miniimonas arenae]HCX83813.1 DUF4244 domain-containing protein [Micrococcales bacterium]